MLFSHLRRWFATPRVSLFFLLFLSLPAHAWAGDVPWLDEVTQAPQDIDLSQVTTLQDADGKPITTLEAWKPKRARILKDWRDFLGAYSPLEESLPLNLEVVESDSLEHCTRTLVRYQAEPGRTVRAYLLVPHNSADKKLPAIVAFHGTSKTTFQKLVGLDGEPERHMGLRLAAAGFVVLCPENYLWEQKSYMDSVEAVLAPHPESRGMAVMLADGMRAVDVLQAQPNVDDNRIGTFGHSLGAKEAMYLAAFDERVCAAVASEGGVGMHSTNWEAPWYLGPIVKSQGFKRDHHDLVALVAPRPCLVLGGETGRGAADGERSWPHVVVGQKVAALYGQPNRIALLNHGQGHSLSIESGEKVIAWLQAYVAGK